MPSDNNTSTPNVPPTMPVFAATRNQSPQFQSTHSSCVPFPKPPFFSRRGLDCTAHDTRPGPRACCMRGKRSVCDFLGQPPRSLDLQGTSFGAPSLLYHPRCIRLLLCTYLPTSKRYVASDGGQPRIHRAHGDELPMIPFLFFLLFSRSTVLDRMTVPGTQPTHISQLDETPPTQRPANGKRCLCPRVG